MKKYILTFLFFYFSLNLFANSGPPGFFQMGGTTSFIPFFKKDSTDLQYIQMQKEWVSIMLYPGFAVVKGEYLMQNLSDKAIDFTTGYPINTQGYIPNAEMVAFDDLYALQVLVNGKTMKVKKMEEINEANVQLKELDILKNWYVWDMKFAPKTTTTITVYFIVNTNEAILRRGYYSREAQGFIYLLETGKVWAKNIEQGRVLIELQEGVELNQIEGILPLSSFLNDGTKYLIWDFENLEPDNKSNVVIRYAEPISNFDLEVVVKEAENYYKKIDEIPIKTLETGDHWKTLNKQNFTIDWTWQNTLTSALLFLGFAGVPIAIVILGISTLIYFIVRAFRKKKS